MKRLAGLFAAVGTLVFALSGCSNGGTFTERAYRSGEEEIQSIVIQVADRELEISVSEDDQVYIDYFDSEKEYLDITVSEEKELTVKLESNKDWTDFIGTKPAAEYRKVQIRLPDELIAELTANTTNENIKVSSLSFTDKVNLNANGGNILCERVNVGKAIGLTAKNGNIAGSIIGGWDDFSISCTVKKGDCNLPALKESGAKAFVADCNNGNIDIEFVR